MSAPLVSFAPYQTSAANRAVGSFDSVQSAIQKMLEAKAYKQNMPYELEKSIAEALISKSAAQYANPINEERYQNQILSNESALLANQRASQEMPYDLQSKIAETLFKQKQSEKINEELKKLRTINDLGIYSPEAVKIQSLINLYKNNSGSLPGESATSTPGAMDQGVIPNEQGMIGNYIQNMILDSFKTPQQKAAELEAIKTNAKLNEENKFKLIDQSQKEYEDSRVGLVNLDRAKEAYDKLSFIERGPLRGNRTAYSEAAQTLDNASKTLASTFIKQMTGVLTDRDLEFIQAQVLSRNLSPESFNELKNYMEEGYRKKQEKSLFVYEKLQEGYPYRQIESEWMKMQESSPLFMSKKEKRIKEIEDKARGR